MEELNVRNQQRQQFAEESESEKEVVPKTKAEMLKESRKRAKKDQKEVF